jgi:hypothetical protein
MKRCSLFICLVLIFLLVAAGIPPASAASPKITGVSPSTAPDAGHFTLTITGSGFTDVTTVRLNKCKLKTGGASEAPFTGEIKSIGPTQIIATFDLTGRKIGEYDLSVNAPHDGFTEDWGVGSGIFYIYSHTGSTPTATKTTGTGTTTEPTETSSGEGDNSVFFESTPSGATIFLNGEEIGTSTFTYYTNRDGTYDVLVKKLGFEDYSAKVTILRGKRVHFSAPLTQLSAGTTPVITGASGTPIKTVTTNKKVTLKLTPLGTFEPTPEESPSGPATVLWAVALGIALLVIRRR